MDVVFHKHFRSSESVTIVFITFSWKATHMEVFQNQQPEGANEVRWFTRKECLARLPLNSEGALLGSLAAGARSLPPRAGPACPPWSTPRRRGPSGFPLAATADQEPRPPSPSGRLGVAPAGSGEWPPKGLRAPGRRKTGQGVDFGVCEEETGLSPLQLANRLLLPEQWTPYRGPAELFTGQRGLTDSPLSPLQQGRSEACADSVGWDFPAECRFLSFQPDATSAWFEFSSIFYLLQKEVKQVLQQR